MEKHRAIPKGFMTVGELAKKMNTTVRTLQYYDKEGILSPSSESEGGRRLYTDKDIIKLHQIQSLKYLGFSLNDIKNRLVLLETPADVAKVLNEHGDSIRGKIAELTDILQAVEKLEAEILQMNYVNWKKYADIIINLKMKNENYGLIKYLDDKTIEHLRSQFDMESARAVMETMERLFRESSECQKMGILPESMQAEKIARQWWEMVQKVTGGDMSLLPNLFEAALNGNDEQWQAKWEANKEFVSQAIEAYFTKLGYNPLEEVTL